MAKSRKAAPNSAPVSTAIRGNIDRISADGMLFGWCLDEFAPSERVRVTVFADGESLGQAIASSLRQDLVSAGIGDGRHGFNFTLPVNILRQQRVCTISACHSDTGIALGGSVTWRAEASANFDDRVAKIERDLLLLQDRMQVTTSNDGAIATLFDAVGTFFARLGQDLRDGGASAEGFGMAGRVDEVAAAYADIILPIPANARFAVLLSASRPIDTVHRRLAAIAKSRICQRADVFLLDDASDVNAALLPAVVRNLRYLRLRDDAVGERDALTRTLHHEVIVFLDAGIEMTAAWIDGLADALLEQDNAGMNGISATTAIDTGTPGKDTPVPMGASVLDVSAAGFAVRSLALGECGGFDHAYDDFGVAVADLCYRMRSAGWAVDRYDPPGDGVAVRHEESAYRRRSLMVLEQRWPAAARSDVRNGIAVCLLTPQSDPGALVSAASMLAEAHYRPVLLSAINRSDAAAMEASLLQSHVEILWGGDVSAAVATLVRMGGDVSIICVPTAEEIPALKTAVAKAGLSSAIKAMAPMLDWLRGEIGAEPNWSREATLEEIPVAP